MASISLTQDRKAIVDDRLYSFLSKYKWHAVKAWKDNFYVRHTMTFYIDGKRRQQGVWLHHLIVGQPRIKRNFTVDHINGNGLDNSESNLRVVTHRENCLNKKLRKEKTSRYKGVSFDKSRNKWTSRIRVGKSILCLGRYDKEEDAYAVYKKELDKLSV